MRFRFPIVIIDEDFRSENASGLGIRALAKAIEAEGGASLMPAGLVDKLPREDLRDLLAYLAKLGK